MKGITLFKTTLLSLFIALVLPATTIAANTTYPLSVSPGDSTENVKTLARITERIDEIKNIDKSTLSTSEKKALKKELKNLKAEARASGGGIYLSVGAIIIIILLLILLL